MQEIKQKEMKKSTTDGDVDAGDGREMPVVAVAEAWLFPDLFALDSIPSLQ